MYFKIAHTLIETIDFAPEEMPEHFLRFRYCADGKAAEVSAETSADVQTEEDRIRYQFAYRENLSPPSDPPRYRTQRLWLYARDNLETRVLWIPGDTAPYAVYREVKEGEKVENWTPTEEGYTFIGWYATPSLKLPFPFDDPITQDTSVFSSWKSSVFQKDEREWIIAGQSSYTGAPLNTNNWGKVQGDARTEFVLNRTAEDKNEFVLTLDLYEGDQFQIADVDVDDNYAWTNQRGYGYLDTETAGEYVKNAGNAFTEDLTKANIEMAMEGNYTLTLTTDMSNSTLDEVTIKRNGDPEVDLEKGTAAVEGGASDAEVIAAIEKAGYKAEK